MTDIEIHALCKKLDPASSGEIEYCGFEKGIHSRVIEDDGEGDDALLPNDYLPELYQSKQALQPGLNDPFRRDYPRLVLAYLGKNKVVFCFFTIYMHSLILLPPEKD